MLSRSVSLYRHLQKSVLERHSFIPVSPTKCTVGLCVALQRTGFVDGLCFGPANQPPSSFTPEETPEPDAIPPDIRPVDTSFPPLLRNLRPPPGLEKPRLWLRFVYRKGAPVMEDIFPIGTKQYKQQTMNVRQLQRLAAGIDADYRTDGLGDCLLVTPLSGSLRPEKRRLITKGGMLLCAVLRTGIDRDQPPESEHLQKMAAWLRSRASRALNACKAAKKKTNAKKEDRQLPKQPFKRVETHEPTTGEYALYSTLSDLRSDPTSDGPRMPG